MEEERGLMGKIWDGAKTLFNGTVDLLAEKVIPQGASELAQALNSQSNAYVPYGHAQQPLEVEGPQQSYQDLLRDASQRGGPEQEREMER